MSYPRELSQDEYDRFNEYLKNVVMRQAADTSFEGIAQEIKTRIDRLLDTRRGSSSRLTAAAARARALSRRGLRSCAAGTFFTWTISSSVPSGAGRSVSPNPAGNVDRERFAAEVLAPLENGSRFSYRPFVCRNMALGDTVEVEPKTVSFIEGA